MPRPPLPPPIGPTATIRFDEADLAFPATALAFTNTQAVESFSGMALCMAGSGPALLALPQIISPNKKVLNAFGTIELWYSPYWESAQIGGTGLGLEARLWEIGIWSGGKAQAMCSLQLDADGNTLRFLAQGPKGAVQLLQATIGWSKGEYHQVALSWSAKGTALYLDGQPVAQGEGLELAFSSQPGELNGLALGSDVQGYTLAQGALDEVYLFDRVCSAEEIAQDFNIIFPQAVLGPITWEEDQARRERAQFLASQRLLSSGPLTTMDACVCTTGAAPHLVMVSAEDSNNVTLFITGGVDREEYDIFRSTSLAGTNCLGAPGPIIPWIWSGRGTNCQTVTLTNQPWPIAFYTVGTWDDPNGDGVSRQHELEASNNVLVNDPSTDDDNEGKNSQHETTLAVNGNMVVCAFIDSKYGQPGLGTCDLCPDDSEWCPDAPVKQIGRCVSQDGGLTFTDMGEPPLLQPGDRGFSSDPWLAWDKTNNILYLVANSQRPSTYYPQGTNAPGELYTPVWRSTNGGLNWDLPVNGTPGIPIYDPGGDATDKPTIIIDQFPGDNLGYVYLAVTVWHRIHSEESNLVLYASTDCGLSWQFRGRFGTLNNRLPLGVNIGIAPDHTVYLVWREGWGGYSRFLISKSDETGYNFDEPTNFLTLQGINDSISRNNYSVPDDYMRAPCFPEFTVNPADGHLYVVYSDKGTQSGDNRDVFFIQSTNRGLDWDGPIRINNDSSLNDQWGPMGCVKPDGTAFFIAWYDRRFDTVSNHLIQVYGTFTSLPISSPTAFSTNTLISNLLFPPVFAGVTRTNIGEFDPVYPPSARSDTNCPTFSGRYAREVGDYDGVVTDNEYIWFSWSDGRRYATNTVSSTNIVVRNQTDIRCIRMRWP